MSTIDTCRAALSQDIQNLIAGKDPKAWVSALKASKPGHLVKLYESTVTFGIQEVAKEAFQALSKLQLKKEYKKRVTCAHTLFQTRIAKAPDANTHNLFTTKVTTKKEVKRLKEIMHKWDQIAKTKEHTAKRLDKHLKRQNQSFSKLDLAEDSEIMTSLMKNIKNRKPEKNEFVYVAYDSSKKLHAICVAEYDKKAGFELDCLIANPENVIVFDHEKAECRGAGTAVVRHLVQDIFSGKRDQKKLSIRSLSSAKPFYEKLGFTSVIDNPYVHFVLNHEHMDAFLKKLPMTATVVDKAPKFKV